MIFLWKILENDDIPWFFLWFFHGFSYGFSMVFLWFFYGFSMVFPKRFSMGFSSETMEFDPGNGCFILTLIGAFPLTNWTCSITFGCERV